MLRSPNKLVLKDCLKESKVSPGRRSPGVRSFHSRGPAAEKLLSPSLLSVLCKVSCKVYFGQRIHVKVKSLLLSIMMVMMQQHHQQVMMQNMNYIAWLYSSAVVDILECRLPDGCPQFSDSW